MVSFDLTIVLFGAETEAKYCDVAPLISEVGINHPYESRQAKIDLKYIS